MILFYHGSDAYRLRSALHGAGVSHVYDASTEEGRLEYERVVKYQSLIPQRTVVALRNVMANAQTAEAVAALFAAYPVQTRTDATVIACHEGSSGRPSAATASLTSYLRAHAQTTTEFAPLTGADRADWVTRFCTERGCTIAPTAIAAVTERTNGDTWALAMELEKICAYAKQYTIDLEMINVLTPSRHDHDEWRLTNAIAAGNKRLALTTLWERLTEGTPVPLLVGLLAHATRTLLTKTGSTPDQRLIRTHRSLAELDYASKNGTMDGEDGLFSIVLNL